MTLAIVTHWVNDECYTLHFDRRCPWKARSQLLRWVLNKELAFGWSDCLYMSGLIRMTEGKPSQCAYIKGMN